MLRGEEDLAAITHHCVQRIDKDGRLEIGRLTPIVHDMGNRKHGSKVGCSLRLEVGLRVGMTRLGVRRLAHLSDQGRWQKPEAPIKAVGRAFKRYPSKFDRDESLRCVPRPELGTSQS